MVSMTSSGWCPPQGGGPPFRWNISARLDGEWSTQAESFGGPPDGVDAGQVLRDWHARCGPDTRWRLRVTPAEDDDTVLFEVEGDLSGWVPPRPRMRLGKQEPPPAPTYWTSALFLPPSAAQLRARHEREQEAGGPT
jgi:hypothetical protein